MFDFIEGDFIEGELFKKLKDNYKNIYNCIYKMKANGQLSSLC